MRIDLVALVAAVAATCGGDRNPRWDSIADLEGQSLVDSIGALAPVDRINLYIYAGQMYHPPRTDVMVQAAAAGGILVNPLIDRLGAARTDPEVEGLTELGDYLLPDMDSEGRAALSSALSQAYGRLGHLARTAVDARRAPR